MAYAIVLCGQLSALHVIFLSTQAKPGYPLGGFCPHEVVHPLWVTGAHPAIKGGPPKGDSSPEVGFYEAGVGKIYPAPRNTAGRGVAGRVAGRAQRNRKK